MSQTVGIYWIVTTFGSWVHGDPRGSWRNGCLIGHDPFVEQSIRERMANDAVVLNVAEMAHVSLIWGQAVAEWQLRVYAATIHPTHAHVIFAPMARDVTTVIAGLKRRSAPPHLWTARPWPVYIDDSGNHLPNAIEYVRDHNRRVDRPADPYPWIDPLYPPR